jgi:hypothetical protein
LKGLKITLGRDTASLAVGGSVDSAIEGLQHRSYSVHKAIRSRFGQATQRV